MIVQFESVPIPEYAATELSIETMLGSIVMQEIPGAIVRAGDADSARDVLRTLSMRIGARGGIVRDPMRGDATLGEAEIGWHVDREPTSSSLTAHLHHTVQGRVKADLAVPRPRLWAPEHGFVPSALPTGVVEQLESGKADDEMFDPTIFTSELGPHDVLTFTVGGPKPTVHNFTTTDGPRRSALYVATMPVDSVGF